MLAVSGQVVRQEVSLVSCGGFGRFVLLLGQSNIIS